MQQFTKLIYRSLACFPLTILFYLILTSLTALLIGSNIIAAFPDAWSFIWNFWWADQAIYNHLDLFNTSKIFYPNLANLTLHTFTAAYSVPMAILLPGVNPIYKYNFTILLILILNFHSIVGFLKESQKHFISEELQSSNQFIYLLAILFVIHPYLIGHFLAGHLNLISIYLPIYLMTWLIQILVQDKLKPTLLVKMTFGLAFTFYISLNYFYFFFLLIPFMVLLTFASGKNKKYQNFLYAFSSILLGCIIISPGIFNIWTSFRSGNFTNNHDPLRHSADLLHFILPGLNQSLSHLVSFSNNLNQAESGLDVGFVFLAVIFISIYLATKTHKNTISRGLGILTISGIFFLLLSLGPAIHVANFTLGIKGSYFYLARILPLFPSVPARFGIIAIIFLFAALNLSRQIFSKNVSYLIILLLFLEFVPDMHTFRYRQTLSTSPVLTSLKNNPKIETIYSATDEYSALLYQIFHEKNVNKGFLARQQKDLLKFNRGPFNRYLTGGHSSISDEKIYSDFIKYKASGILTEVSNPQINEKLTKLPWLRKSDSDDKFTYYELSSNQK